MGLGIKPISSRIIVLVDKEESDIKVGMIHIPKNLNDKDFKLFESGRVIQIGENAFDYLDNCPVKKGDRVFFTKYAGIGLATFEKLTNDQNDPNLSKRLRVLKDDDIQAIETETDWVPENKSWCEISEQDEEFVLKNL